MKTAVVTGASSGIGKEICRMLNGHGIRVYGIGRTFCEDQAAQTPLFIPIICDLSDTAALTGLIRRILSETPVDILINNAGTAYYGPHEELNPQKIHEMVAVNLEAPLILTQLLLRSLKAQQGAVINISSVTAKHSGNTHGCAYGATKAGLSSFTASLFEEVRKYGVRVVAIHPDMTRTGLYRNADFCCAEDQECALSPKTVARAVETALFADSGCVITDITLQPQKRKILRKANEK